MTQAGMEAEAFFRQVAAALELWTVVDEDGDSPVAKTPSGRGAVPFWSSLARAQSAVEAVKSYKGMKPYRVTWEDFVLRWAPHMTRDRALAGLNWAGADAHGHDMDPVEVVRRVVDQMEERPEEKA